VKDINDQTKYAVKGLDKNFLKMH